jgi:protein tyrosine phosphatase type 4A
MIHSIYFDTSKFSNTNINFLVLEEPTNTNFNSYIEMLKKYNIKYLISTCPIDINDELNKKLNNIVNTIDIYVDDGKFPTNDILNNWKKFLSTILKIHILPQTIAIHCKSGLGRSPLMVTIALIELYKIKPYKAIDFVRKKNNKLLNTYQLNQIYEKYTNVTKCSCIIF